MSCDAPVIKVQNLSKVFRIYDRQRHRLNQMALPAKRLLTGREHANYYREFWALKDINFEIGKGQTVGIIGQNGSGKSTLLQIIAGTMEPTLGDVMTQGKIAALLELGSGFNPDFTGRENVYLNGNLLGLTRAQIDERFDYIAAFAEVGDHLDMPVKTYSSGMMLRLAFAVQVAVQTQILIIDEALAVGDARFQAKCFRRLEELKTSGTTILFVSHSTELVRSFCDYGLVLDKGKAIYWGEARTATLKYLATVFPDQTSPQAASKADEVVAPQQNVRDADGRLTLYPDQSEVHSFGVGGATLDWVKIRGLGVPNLVVGGSEMNIACKFSWDRAFVQGLVDSEGYEPNITLGITVANKKGEYLFGCNGFDKQRPIDCLSQTSQVVEFTLKMPHLVEGDYYLTVAIAFGSLRQHVQLKWYDGVLSLKWMEAEKKAFGLMAVDYEMNLIESIEDSRE